MCTRRQHNEIHQPTFLFSSFWKFTIAPQIDKDPEGDSDAPHANRAREQLAHQTNNEADGHGTSTVAPEGQQ